MTELINIITSKPDWSTKINNKSIVEKWSTELLKQDVDPIILTLVIKLLQNYKSESEYDDCDDYKWALKLGTHPDDFSLAKDCKCKCKICEGAEGQDSYSDESDSDDYAYRPTYTQPSECTCTESKLNQKKKTFMLKFMHLNNTLIDPQAKHIFKHNVRYLEKTIPVDYHPGTNNQVINLVHPSMYCYVDSVTKTKQKMDSNILFQWLPAEFAVKHDKVSINSYINNLDYETNSELYGSIATIFESFVPKFNHVLKVLHNTDRINNFKKLSDCQVIVKLANTILTPESPEFPAGTWHLEGLPHEKIIATGIYYYEMKNITSNYLNFRSTITDGSDVDYQQNCSEYVKKHYGFDDVDNTYSGHECIINLGRIKTKEDMCLVFPNFMQHRVSNFKLVDNTKIGTRKILVFFLIDPLERILSTADVKPQQSLMTLDNAKIYRELLMFQRKYEVTDQNSFFERSWSLCEH